MEIQPKNEGILALERMTSDHDVYENYGAEEFKKDYELVKNMLEANDVLRFIWEAPSILEQLFKLGQLGKEAQERYFWGTITDSRVEKVKEFFADGKRDQSK